MKNRSISYFIAAAAMTLPYSGNVSAAICGGTPCVDSVDIINGRVTSADLAATAQTSVKSDAGANIWTYIPGHPSATDSGKGNPLRTITVSAPGAGQLIVTATGTVSAQHFQGTKSFLCLGLSDLSGNAGGCAPYTDSSAAFRSGYPANFPQFDDMGIPYSLIRTFAVTGASTKTFYLNGYADGLNASLFHPTFTVEYVPRLLP
jgi:hypothetical protein